MTRLADPPREVPLGLQLKLLAHRDVTATLLYFVPATAALIFAAASFAQALNLGLVLLAGVLVLIAAILVRLGLYSALPALWRAMRTIASMRHGFLAVGRIVSCRLAWDSKGKEMPYAEFLSNWPANLAEVQMRKAGGCTAAFLATIFLGPPIVFMLFVAAAFAAVTLRIPALGDAIWTSLDVPHVARSIATLAPFIVAGMSCVMAALLLLRFYRWRRVNALTPHVEGRHLGRPGSHEVYDQEALRLVESAKQPENQVLLRTPLPEKYQGIDLTCRAEYSVQGERRTSEGRVRLCDRLDPAGVELLLFRPESLEKVIFLAGLPREARVDPWGRWGPVADGGSTAGLVFTGLFACAALAGLVFDVARIVTIFRSMYFPCALEPSGPASRYRRGVST